MSETDEINRLRGDLLVARLTVIRLMSEPIQEILNGWKKCSSLEDFLAWQQSAAEQIVAIADVKVPEEMQSLGSSTPRAYCPLCHESTEWFNLEGFAYPDGLLRHLMGTHRATPCAVFAIACELAKENVKLLSKAVNHTAGA
jgi:hypothetical protein